MTRSINIQVVVTWKKAGLVEHFYFSNLADGVGPFGIIEPKDLITEGDTVELTCAASIYNYTNELTWVNRSDVPIEKTGNRLRNCNSIFMY